MKWNGFEDTVKKVENAYPAYMTILVNMKSNRVWAETGLSARNQLNEHIQEVDQACWERGNIAPALQVELERMYDRYLDKPFEEKPIGKGFLEAWEKKHTGHDDR
jgi:hypothetical protein